MPIKVLVNGAKGRMGKVSIYAVSTDPELMLVGQTDIGDDLAGTIKDSKAQVVIDFTHPSVAVGNVEIILDSETRPVIGTTGFTSEDIHNLQEIARRKNLGGIIAPNFAIGAVLMMKYSADASKYLPQVEIVEYHHDNKADAPSGTAIKTAELILEANSKIKGPRKESKEEIPHALGAKMGSIRIHAIRVQGFVASQEVILGGLGQTLKIRHDTINRESFVPGILLACKKVMRLNELVYGLEKIL